MTDLVEYGEGIENRFERLGRNQAQLVRRHSSTLAEGCIYGRRGANRRGPPVSFGALDRRELALLVAGFDWDDTSDSKLRLREPVGKLELLIEEVGEGFRPEAELLLFVAAYLKASGRPEPQRTDSEPLPGSRHRP